MGVAMPYIYLDILCIYIASLSRLWQKTILGDWDYHLVVFYPQLLALQNKQGHFHKFNSSPSHPISISISILDIHSPFSIRHPLTLFFSLLSYPSQGWEKFKKKIQKQIKKKIKENKINLARRYIYLFSLFFVFFFFLSLSFFFLLILYVPFIKYTSSLRSLPWGFLFFFTAIPTFNSFYIFALNTLLPPPPSWVHDTYLHSKTTTDDCSLPLHILSFHTPLTMYSCINYPRGCRGRVNDEGGKCTTCQVCSSSFFP